MKFRISERDSVTAMLLMTFLSAVAGVSCIQAFPAQTMPPSFDYYRFQDGQIIEKTVVHEGDPAYDALRKLVGSHRAGWNIDLNTYAPELSFQSKNMTIDCRDDMVVVNFRESGTGSMTQLTNNFPGCRTKVLDAIRGQLGARH